MDIYLCVYKESQWHQWHIPSVLRSIFYFSIIWSTFTSDDRIVCMARKLNLNQKAMVFTLNHKFMNSMEILDTLLEERGSYQNHLTIT